MKGNTWGLDVGVDIYYMSFETGDNRYSEVLFCGTKNKA